MVCATLTPDHFWVKGRRAARQAMALPALAWGAVAAVGVLFSLLGGEAPLPAAGSHSAGCSLGWP